MPEKKKQIYFKAALSPRKTRVLFRSFLLFFLISFLIINWNDISWLFNYHFIASVLSDFVLAESQESSRKEQEALSETEEPTARPVRYTQKEDGIFIPRVEIQAPLVFSPSSEPQDMAASLKKGVAHYPDSALPGEKGEVIVLGHTAPGSWPETSYYAVFNRLVELEEGDKIFVYFENREYSYKVIGRFFVEEGEELPTSPLTNSESVLVLLGCWPLGNRSQRIAVKAEEII